MTVKEKIPAPMSNRSAKHHRVYGWIIVIGILLLIVTWLYFEDK